VLLGRRWKPRGSSSSAMQAMQTQGGRDAGAGAEMEAQGDHDLWVGVQEQGNRRCRIRGSVSWDGDAGGGSPRLWGDDADAGGWLPRHAGDVGEGGPRCRRRDGDGGAGGARPLGR
jgi:hypothetical protein